MKKQRRKQNIERKRENERKSEVVQVVSSFFLAHILLAALIICSTNSCDFKTIKEYQTSYNTKQKTSGFLIHTCQQVGLFIQCIDYFYCVVWLQNYHKVFSNGLFDNKKTSITVEINKKFVKLCLVKSFFFYFMYFNYFLFLTFNVIY